MIIFFLPISSCASKYTQTFIANVDLQKQTGYFGNIVSQTKSLHIDTLSGRHSPSPPLRGSPGAVVMPHQPSPRKTSGPNTPSVRSPLGRPQYVDVAVQTDPNENDADFVPPTTPIRKHHFVPLTQRLLKRCHEDRVKVDSSGSLSLHSPTLLYGQPSASPTLASSGFPQPLLPQKPLSVEHDVHLKDADTEMTPTIGDRSGQFDHSGVCSTIRTPDSANKYSFASTFPSTAAHIIRIPQTSPNGARSSLHVQLPPNNFSAAFSSSSVPATPGSLQSPSIDVTSATSTLQTPSGASIAAPSPVKKKLSLGDYLSRRGTLTTPASEKSQAQSGAVLPFQSSPQTHGPSPVPSADIAGHTAVGPDGVKVESPVSVEASMRDAQKQTLPPP